jgi:hypothetical protein
MRNFYSDADIIQVKRIEECRLKKENSDKKEDLKNLDLRFKNVE